MIPVFCQIIVSILLLFSVFSCNSANRENDVKLTFVTDTVQFSVENVLGTITNEQVSRRRGQLEYQFKNINNNCIVCIGLDGRHNNFCLDKDGPNRIDPLAFEINEENIFVYDREKALILNFETSDRKRMSLILPDSVVGGQVPKMNDNMWFDAGNFSDKTENVYFFPVRVNTRGGDIFKNLIAVDLDAAKMTLIEVPKPEGHDAAIPIAHFPLFSAMYYPYVTVCGSNLVLSYALYNEVYSYDLNQSEVNYTGEWKRIDFSSRDETTKSLDFSSATPTTEFMYKIKKSNYHYGPYKGDGSYIYQIYQKPNADLVKESYDYGLRVFRNDLSEKIGEFDLPSSLSYRSFSVVEDQLYINIISDDEDTVSFLRFSKN
jgi:hypothetical protein